MIMIMIMIHVYIYIYIYTIISISINNNNNNNDCYYYLLRVAAGPLVGGRVVDPEVLEHTMLCSYTMLECRMYICYIMVYYVECILWYTMLDYVRM